MYNSCKKKQQIKLPYNIFEYFQYSIGYKEKYVLRWREKFETS